MNSLSASILRLQVPFLHRYVSTLILMMTIFPDDVDDGRDDEEHQGYLDQAREVDPARSLGELVGDDAGHGVGGGEYAPRQDVRVPYHHGYGHGLPQGPPEGEEHACDDAGAGIGEDHLPDDLEPRRAQGEGRLLQVRGHQADHLPAKGGRIGDDHYGEHEGGGQDADPVGGDAECTSTNLTVGTRKNNAQNP